MADTPLRQHQIDYPDSAALQDVLAVLKGFPPLVFPGEVDELRTRLVAVSEGRAFILQGGDCVERFSDCTAERITDKIKILLQMSVVLTHAARMPVLRIGRIAGQYFKPRSQEFEQIQGRRVLTYRGDPVHRFDPRGDNRTPDPRRLLEGYFHAAATHNYIRAMIAGGFADLHHPLAWDLTSMEGTPQWQEYRHVVDRILEAISFMESFGGLNQESLGNIDFYTSHEALHLPWEEAMTRRDPATGNLYNLAAHTVWLGARTNGVDEGHVDYLRQIANPLGIKVGPEMTADHLAALLRLLDPQRTPGRITLITRLGADRVHTRLPELLRVTREEGNPVIWSCDPMHGNTVATTGGRKTRTFTAILQELEHTFGVHRVAGSIVNGVHFELTGDEVTECTGGAVPLGEADLDRNYESWCDPRLNYTQSMEMAFLLGKLLRE